MSGDTPRRLPELNELEEIPMFLPPGTPPERIRDYMAGFQAAWQLAKSIEASHERAMPRGSTE